MTVTVVSLMLVKLDPYGIQCGLGTLWCVVPDPPTWVGEMSASFVLGVAEDYFEKVGVSHPAKVSVAFNPIRRHPVPF